MRAAFGVLLLAALCCLAAAEGADDASSTYLKAAQALAKGDKLAALPLLTATLKQQPNFLPVRARRLTSLSHASRSPRLRDRSSSLPPPPSPVVRCTFKAFGAWPGHRSAVLCSLQGGSST